MEWIKKLFKKRVSKIGQDFEDNLPTKGKRYYLAHTDYVYKTESEHYRMFGDDIQKITQLVCASNQENARQAIEKSLGKDVLILKNRIDYLIVGN